jgi:hypothetical protein
MKATKPIVGYDRLAQNVAGDVCSKPCDQAADGFNWPIGPAAALRGRRIAGGTWEIVRKEEENSQQNSQRNNNDGHPDRYSSHTSSYRLRSIYGLSQHG